MTVRLGGVPYGVGAPLLAGLESEPGVQLRKAPPTTLVRGLRDGTLDAALVSSIEAVRAPGYTVAPDLGIACKREIRSVRAFRRRGAAIRRVGLDASSATSVALLRLLLANVHRADTAADVQFETIAPVGTPALLPHDLVLLIGDTGLHAEAGDREVWDLGAEWRSWTGLPFVFALWLLRPGAAADRVLPVLRAARERGRQLGAVDGTHGAAHYDLDEDDRRGLRRFWAECRAHGLATAADPPILSAAPGC
ncbi:MAG: menaquinone biosynthesis protein [Planctomycetes bacterium]|nr:menaquinone biosynthesis protein [Planctomycetota bacterium]